MILVKKKKKKKKEKKKKVILSSVFLRLFRVRDRGLAVSIWIDQDLSVKFPGSLNFSINYMHHASQ